jgi:hypothetical protein
MDALKTAAVIVSIVLTFVIGVSVGIENAPKPSKTDYRVAAPEPPKPEENPQWGVNESLSSGFVRVINTDQKMVVYETDYGFVKTFEPYCAKEVPVWVGMRLYQLNFRWVPRFVQDDETKGNCYAFDYIGHADHGDLEMKMVPK